MTAFINVNVIPMDTERMLLGQTVLVEKGWITALGASSEVKVPPRATQIDGQGKFLIPGLSDCHAHVRPIHDRTEQRLVSQRKLLKLLAEGITTIRIMDRYGDSNSALTLQFKARAAAGELLSPHIYSGVSVQQLQKKAPDTLLQELTRYKAAGYDFVKIRFEGHNLPKFNALMAAARQVGLPVVGHYPGAATLEQALASGMRSIEHVTHLPLALLGPSALIPGQWFDGETSISVQDSSALLRYRAAVEAAKDSALANRMFDPAPDTLQARIAAMRRAGVWFCPTLYVAEGGSTLLRYAAGNNPIWALLDTAAIQKRAKKLVRQLQDGGVGLLLGTDDYGPVAGELRLLVGAGLTPYEALATGTRNMAQYLGLLSTTGTIAAGKRADLVLLRGNPLQDIRNTEQPAGVILGGRWLLPEELDRRRAELERQRTPGP